ncbi:hypothetical protein [Aquabacterium sp.]|uniref:hypothetical protein n=1 Tax=Aquabacterium sp. TaxID=1872578 RepID=UPI0025C12606|nr:hypothetical protein [Aquabacterium sp.]MBI3382194.1 hypothetical protein [Aquabacterium sp.]
MNPQDILARNRVILCHFDSYSTALLFARWGGSTLLWPEALPESAKPMAPPEAMAPEQDAQVVKQAVVDRYGLNPAELLHLGDFNHWAQTDAGPVRIHLLRFDTFEAPKAAIAEHGGVFKAISELRGSNMAELLLLREVFNLIVGAGGGRG